MRESLNPPPKREKIGTELRRAATFSPPACGGKCRNATEGGRPCAERRYAHPRRCARTPPLPTASPPQGREKIPSQTPSRAAKFSPPACGGRKFRTKRPAVQQNFLPQLAGGDVATRQRGAPVRRTALRTPPDAAGVPPSAWRHLHPGGNWSQTPSRAARIFSPSLRGEKIESRRHLPQGEKIPSRARRTSFGRVTPERSPARPLSRPLRSDRRFAPAW